MNSFYVDMDTEPKDPMSSWHIPLTSGFEQRTGATRGTTYCRCPRLCADVFHLAAGPHTLILRGREPGVKLDRLTITRATTPPSNIRTVVGLQ